MDAAPVAVRWPYHSHSDVISSAYQVVSGWLVRRLPWLLEVDVLRGVQLRRFRTGSPCHTTLSLGECRPVWPWQKLGVRVHQCRGSRSLWNSNILNIPYYLSHTLSCIPLWLSVSLCLFSIPLLQTHVRRCSGEVVTPLLLTLCFVMVAFIKSLLCVLLMGTGYCMSTWHCETTVACCEGSHCLPLFIPGS